MEGALWGGGGCMWTKWFHQLNAICSRGRGGLVRFPCCPGNTVRASDDLLHDGSSVPSTFYIYIYFNLLLSFFLCSTWRFVLCWVPHLKGNQPGPPTGSHFRAFRMKDNKGTTIRKSTNSKIMVR